MESRERCGLRQDESAHVMPQRKDTKMAMTTVLSSDAFCETDFLKYRESFWALPSRLGQPEHGYPLAELRRAGGDGVFCLLPLLGMIAGLHIRDRFGLSIQRIAQLTGADPKTIQRARHAVHEAGIATASPMPWMGKRFVRWDVSPRLSGFSGGEDADTAADGPRTGYHYFSMRLIYGGTWALMPHRVKALYIGVALHASTFPDPVQALWMLDFLKDGVTLNDFEAARAHAALHFSDARVRIACASYPDLSRVTGVSEDTLMRASADIRHPNEWSRVTTAEGSLKYMPLRVYPTRAGHSLIYHLRDHAPHVPWAITANPGWWKPGVLAALLSHHDAEVSVAL
jgi:hypothetical protein